MVISHTYCSGLGGLRKKLAGRFKSNRPRADDADYNPTIDSEAQSSARVAFLWTQKMFLTLFLTIRLTSKGGLIQRGDSLWQNIAPGGQSTSMLCPQTPIFSSFILSFNLMSSGAH
jgi:hypothetical protein